MKWPAPSAGRQHFGLDGPIATPFDWLSSACKTNTGLSGESRDRRSWLRPVNCIYRLTRSSYAHFGLRLPDPVAAIHTAAAALALADELLFQPRGVHRLHGARSLHDPK